MLQASGPGSAEMKRDTVSSFELLIVEQKLLKSSSQMFPNEDLHVMSPKFYDHFNNSCIY